MTKYHLKISPKTAFLNVFRSLFTIPVFEKVLVAKTLNNSGQFWQKVIPPDYLYKKGSFRLVTRNGIKYKLDISNVVDHHLYYGIQESGYLSILEELKSAKTILDIGANIGTTALFFASINPNAQILAFEPHPETYKRAVDNIKLNSFGNIDLINIGLGEKKDTLKLYEVNENNPGMNRIMAEDNALPFKTIQVEKLDEFLAGRNIAKIDFVKIDVEGFEYFVLAGGKEIIQKSRPVMLMELDDDYLRENNRSSKELIELLLSFGYKNFYRADTLAPITLQTDFDNSHFDLIVR